MDEHLDHAWCEAEKVRPAEVDAKVSDSAPVKSDAPDELSRPSSTSHATGQNDELATPTQREQAVSHQRSRTPPSAGPGASKYRLAGTSVPTNRYAPPSFANGPELPGMRHVSSYRSPQQQRYNRSPPAWNHAPPPGRQNDTTSRGQPAPDAHRSLAQNGRSQADMCNSRNSRSPDRRPSMTRSATTERHQPSGPPNYASLGANRRLAYDAAHLQQTAGSDPACESPARSYETHAPGRLRDASRDVPINRHPKVGEASERITSHDNSGDSQTRCRPPNGPKHNRPEPPNVAEPCNTKVSLLDRLDPPVPAWPKSPEDWLRAISCRMATTRSIVKREMGLNGKIRRMLQRLRCFWSI